MSDPGDNLRRLTGLYRTMARIRAFEETALEAHKAGEIPGPLHVSIGQEAVAAGICLNLRKDDRLTSNHRGHGHARHHAFHAGLGHHAHNHHVAVIAAAHVSRHGLRARRSAQAATCRLTPTSWTAGW